METTTRTSRLETLANLSTIVVSLLLSVVLIKVFLLPQAAPRRTSVATAQALKGTSLKESLPGID